MANVARYEVDNDLRPGPNENLFTRDHAGGNDNVYPLVLVTMEVDGKIKEVPMIVQDAHPETPPGQGAMYLYDLDDVGEVCYRPEDNGDPVYLTRAGLPAGMVPGAASGLLFRSTGDAQITFTGGGRDINGQIYILDALTPVTFAGLSASAYHYILAAKPSDGYKLTAGDISVATSAPVQDHAQGGAWYDSGKRCIGFFKTDPSSKIIPCYRRGRWLVFRDPQIYFLNVSSPSTSLVGINTGAPPLGRLDVMLAGSIYGQSGSVFAHFVNGECTDVTGDINVLGITANGANPVTAYREFVLTTNNVQEIKYQASNNLASTGLKTQLLRVAAPDGM